MTLAGFFYVLALVSVGATLTALVRARTLFFLSPLYFLVAWLTGELALHHIAWQLAFTLFCVTAGVLETSDGQWGLALFVLNWILLWRLHNVATMTTPKVFQNALEQGLGADFRDSIPAERRTLLRDEVHLSDWIRPFRMRRPGVTRFSDIVYGDAGERNMLDVYQPAQSLEGGSPVLLQVHGGGWVIGKKEEQALPLMYHLAERGWVCVAINYRLSPLHAMPAHIIDVKRAIGWIRENIGNYGGNPDFLAITGGSAGGHLSSLAALTGNMPELQPEMEDLDTSIQAAVPFYGVYDFLDRHNIRGRMSMENFLAERVFKVSRQENPEIWERCSSISHVSADAPPAFMIHGTHDTLVFNEEAQVFVDALSAVSKNPVLHAELPGAQHAYEIFHSPRTEYTLNAVTEFLEWAYARWKSGSVQHTRDDEIVA